MILVQVAYIKTLTDGTVLPARELQFTDFTRGAALSFLKKDQTDLCEQDTVTDQDLPHFRMITVEVAQEKAWTYERHIFIAKK